MPDDEKKIAGGALGSVGKYELDEKGGNINAQISITEGPLTVSVTVGLSVTDMLKTLKGHGVIADEIIDAACAELAKL